MGFISSYEQGNPNSAKKFAEWETPKQVVYPKQGTHTFQTPELRALFNQPKIDVKPIQGFSTQANQLISNIANIKQQRLNLDHQKTLSNMYNQTTHNQTQLQATKLNEAGATNRIAMQNQNNLDIAKLRTNTTTQMTPYEQSMSELKEQQQRDFRAKNVDNLFVEYKNLNDNEKNIAKNMYIQYGAMPQFKKGAKDGWFGEYEDDVLDMDYYNQFLQPKQPQPQQQIGVPQQSQQPQTKQQPTQNYDLNSSIWLKY